MSTDKFISSLSTAIPLSAISRLTQEESAKFLRIVLDALTIQRHYQLFMWLRGEFQDFLPHEILVSASGDFGAWLVKLDVVSTLSEVRTKQLADCSIDPFVEVAHSQWVKGQRRPLFLDPTDMHPALAEGSCTLHRALREMQSIVVHGVHDFREGHDSIYVMQNREPLSGPEVKERRLFLLDLLIAQIDMAFRRVAGLPLAVRKGRNHDGNDGLNLSAREQEILDLICRGETNSDIAATLAISPFTVKNHLQRIFKKIGVNNRTQAATKYNQALLELRKFLT